MKKFRVKANPKSGTCFQDIEAETEDEAINKAWDNPNGWHSPSPKARKDWFFHAREVRQ